MAEKTPGTRSREVHTTANLNIALKACRLVSDEGASCWVDARVHGLGSLLFTTPVYSTPVEAMEDAVKKLESIEAQ